MACLGNAVTSTASIVSGAFIPVASHNPTGLQSALPKKLHQSSGNCRKGHNLHGGAGFCRGFGHAVDHTAGLILGNSMPSGTTQNGQSFRTIPPHTSEHYPNSPGRPVLRAIIDEAFEEHV